MTQVPISTPPEPLEKGSNASHRQSSNWDIKNAPRNYISIVGFQVGSALFSFASVLLITRYLGSEGYGGIIATIAASQVAQVMVNWTSMSVVRFGVDEFIESEKIARTFWTRLIVLTVNLFLVILFANIWFPPLASWLKLPPESFSLVVLHFAVTAVWIHIQMSLQGAKMPGTQGLLQMLERVVIFGSLLVLLINDRFEFFGIVACYIFAPAVMLAAGLVPLRTYFLAKFTFDHQFIKKIIAYSIPLLPFALVGYFAGGYVDAIFVSNFLSTSDLGLYSVATQLNGIALQLPTLTSSLLLPLLVTLNREGQTEKTYGYFQNLLPSLTLAWGLICVAVSLAAYFTIPFLFGEHFFASVLPFWILMVAAAVSLPALAGYFPLAHSISATYIIMFGALVAAIVNIAANFLLIPRYGLLGCAWATVLSYVVNVILSGVLLKRAANIPISWNITAMIPPICAGIVLSLTQNPWFSFGVCLVLVFLLFCLKRKEIATSFELAIGYRNKIRL